MEYTQWVKFHFDRTLDIGLNPCCNGIYSMSCREPFNKKNGSLNPCCNGIYSMSMSRNDNPLLGGLNPCCNGIYSMSSLHEITHHLCVEVLILVVMEYTQWGLISSWKLLLASLNPCCNGIYSMRDYSHPTLMGSFVLILVVMEYTQWEDEWRCFKKANLVLILVVMEYTQWVYYLTDIVDIQVS